MLINTPRSKIELSSPASAMSGNTSPLNILLVEDSASDAEYMQIMLDSCDVLHTVERLKKGTDVLPRLSHNPVDLMPLDLGLPCLDGFEVLAELMSRHETIRNTPIVILTGYENFMYLKNTYEPYIFDYITKPCSPEKLCSILLHLNTARCSL